MATEAFLRVAHGLDVVPGDETEMALMRAMENPPDFHARLIDLHARLREMDVLGQDMAVLSLNPPGVQPCSAADTGRRPGSSTTRWPRSCGSTRAGSVAWPRWRRRFRSAS
jgi:hypothetical protein